MGRRIQGQIFRHGFDSDVFVQNGLVTFYAKRGEIELANKVFGRLSDKTIVTWTSMISGYAQNGKSLEALRVYGQMRNTNLTPEWITFVSVLKAYIDIEGLEGGKCIHGCTIKMGFELVPDLVVALTAFYAKCGQVIVAKFFFDQVESPKLILWNAMISGYAKNGHAEEAVELFRRMVNKKVGPDSISVTSSISACGQVGSIADAGKLFDEMPERNIVTWNAYISNAVLNGEKEKACIAFMKCRKLGIEPTDYVISSVVSACAELAGMELGRSVHALAVKSCVDADVYVGSALVDMYGKCGSIHDAEQTFREMPEKNLFAWNAMISGYAHQGHADMAIRLFREMASMGGEPDGITLCAFLNACADTLNLVLGKQLHGFVMRSGFESDVSVSNGLIDFYGKCKEVGLAEMVFDGMERRNLVTWGSMVATYEQNGEKEKACIAFMKCRKLGIEPTDYVISSVVSACAELAGIELGRSVHALAVKSCVDADVYVGSALVDMYGNCGSIHDAEQTFREMPEKNLFAWNAMISGYAHQGHADMAIRLFREMASMGGEPDGITLCAFLNACADTLNLVLGKQLHGFVMRSGFESDVSVSNGLIDFYGKCKEVGLAEMVFDGMERRNLVTWGSMVATYEQNGEKEKACIAFMKCRKLGIEPTDYMISSVVSACAELAGIELGRSVHALAVKSCVDADVYVGSALVDMYGKCESIHDAEQTFREMPEKNLFAWNAMISGYAHQGHADMAIGLFREMASVVAPNYVTFVFVLSACSRGGAVETGMDVYESMMKKYGIEAGPEHYACVVDMLARSGLVERAYDFVQKLPIRPTISIWGALLNACRVHGKPEIGKIAADNLFELDPKDSGNHVLLSNMFAVAGR
ncbi:Pentatricopeptide repeat-containing protein At4g14850 [Linum perenne]